MNDTAGDRDGRDGEEILDEQGEDLVNEELEEHDIPPLPEGTAPDGPAPAA
jgi:hypothetical protein